MSQINRLMSSFRNAHVYGDIDRDEALHEAINAVFDVSEERKAHLYCLLDAKWDEYPHGVMRRIYIKQVLQQWHQDHLFDRTPPLAQETEE